MGVCAARRCIRKRGALFWWGGLVVVLLLPLQSVQAAFSSYLPLTFSGDVSYSYGYVSSSVDSETTALTGAVNAFGYIWQPWFATTAASINMGLAKTTTTASSSDAQIVSGAFSVNVFPRSRFPFSMTFSHSDGRSDVFSDVTQVTGSTDYQSTRFSLRQMYRARSGSLTNAWYYLTNFDSAGTSSDSTSYGASYQLHSAPSSYSVTANRSQSESSASALKPVSDVISLNHTYTPSPDSGVTNVASYIQNDSGSGGSNSRIAQASSSFFWRPEHRSFSLNGGVRVADNVSTSDLGDEKTQKNLGTNLGINYRLSRRAAITAGITVGASDSADSQSLSTSQTISASYASSQYPLGDSTSYSWQGNVSAGNSSTRSDAGGVRETTNVQGVGAGLGHNLSSSWSMGSRSSLNAGFSQSLSSNKSSEDEGYSGSLGNSLNFSFNRRGMAGSTYGSVQLSDSRAIGGRESVFQRLGLSLSQDMSLSHVSSLNANFSYSQNRQRYEVEVISTDPLGNQYSEIVQQEGEGKFLTANLFYHHDRPFTIHNLRFDSRLIANKEIGTNLPTQTLDWDSRFQYSLGLLSSSIGFRLIKNAGGTPTKTFNFRATRSF